VNSVSLDICLTHTAPGDLLWKITPPSSVTSLPITVPANWNDTGTDCDLGNSVRGKFQRINLLQTVQSTVTTKGLWTLNVSDQRPGDEGNLVQWRLLIQGLN
jgi:subtilisin-like proprotein convertase family protein